MTRHVGIDLGTTFSAVACYDRDKGKARVINNREGNPVTPSVLCYEQGSILYGEEAKEMQAIGALDTVAFFKRDMGNPDYAVRLGPETLGAEDLAALFLRFLIKDAEESLGEKITAAVITVPAYFNNHQREATIRAGEKAGLEVLRIINEPSAAAIAYGMTGKGRSSRLMVYDLGGGTFDVAVVEVNGDEIRTLGIDGNHQLGGKNWDDAIAADFARRFANDFGADLFGCSEDYYELLVRVEQAKKKLSVMEKVQVAVAGAGHKARYELTHKDFNNLTADLMESTKMLCTNLLQDIKLGWSDLDGVLLVGGSTRMKIISEFVKEMSGREPLSGILVDEVVALGAAVQAEIDMQRRGSLQSKGSQTRLAGAMRITDVTAHSLGMVAISEDRSRYLNRILIPKHTVVPCTKSKPFKINSRHCPAGQTEVYLLQGESEKPLECAILGRYIVSELDNSGSEEIIIDISYDYDENSVVQVGARQRNFDRDLPVRVEEVPADLGWLNGSPDEQGSGIVQPASILLAVDLSGSMAGTPLEKAKEAACRLVDNLDLNAVSVGLIIFADQNRVITSPTRDIKQLYRSIQGMAIGQVGYGNADDPFSEVQRILGRKRKNEDRYAVVLTDGVWEKQRIAEEKARRCKAAGIEVVAIGFGGADKQFLQEIASSDENALFTNLEGLASSFSTIAQVITEKSSSGLKFF